MKNSKICNNCGYDNTEAISSNYCVKCGNKLNNDVVDNNIDKIQTNKDKKLKNKKSNRLELIFTIVCLLPVILLVLRVDTSSQIFNVIVSICSAASIFILIFGIVNYPNDVFFKVVMWLAIIATIFSIIVPITILVACFANIS